MDARLLLVHTGVMAIEEEPRQEAAVIVIIEDHDQAGLVFRRVLAPFWETLLFTSARDFMAWLSPERRICALLIDEGLRDGSGTQLARTVRDLPQFSRTPITIMTGVHSHSVCATAYRMQARYLCKPLDDADLMAFLALALVYQSTGDMPHAELVASKLVAKWELTPPEVELVLRQLWGERRSDIAKARSISVNTYKSCVRSILRKTGAMRISLLLQQLAHRPG